MQILDPSGQKLLQIEIQLQAVLQNTVAESGCQRRFPAIQPIPA